MQALWRGLSGDKIFPRSFRTSAPVDPSVLRYLSAHPGLQWLELSQIPRVFDPKEFDIHADTFYTTVLPRHATTLTHLSICPGRHGRWAFNVHNAGAILQCQALKHLSMALSEPNHEDDFPQTARESDEEDKPTQLRVDRIESAFPIQLLLIITF